MENISFIKRHLSENFSVTKYLLDIFSKIDLISMKLWVLI